MSNSIPSIAGPHGPQKTFSSPEPNQLAQEHQGSTAQPDSCLRGQSKAKAVLTQAVLSYQLGLTDQGDRDIAKGIKPYSVLLIGPDGCGKTTLARQAGQASGLPLLEFHLGEFAPPGCPGRQFDYIFHQLASWWEPQDLAGPSGIIILEGFETLIPRSAASNDRAFTCQHALASILKGTSTRVNAHGRITPFHSSRVLFFLVGNLNPGPRSAIGFQCEPSTVSNIDLAAFGFEDNLIGSISQHLELPPLSVDDLVYIACQPGQVLDRWRSRFLQLGIALKFLPEAIVAFSQIAFGLSAGARGLDRLVDQRLGQLLGSMQSLSLNIREADITKEFVLRNDRPVFREGTPRVPFNQVLSGTHGAAKKPDPSGALFPEGTLPKRPSRATASAALGLGRWANEADLKRWLR